MDSNTEVLMQPIAEIKPFEHTPAQNFLTRWCRANDALTPNFISSDEWVEGTPLVQRKADNSITLNIPSDVRLWELIPFIQTIDGDTYRNRPQAIEKLDEGHEKRARLFTNTGIYIAQRLDGISQGHDIAQELAREFYVYGKRLERSAFFEDTPEIDPDTITFDQIASAELSDDETKEIDEWIAGDELYASRLNRADRHRIKNHTPLATNIERERIRALNQVFKLAQHSINHQPDQTVTQKVLAEKPYYAIFMQKIKDRIKKGVEDPMQDLMVSIYDRGLEDLKHEFIRSPDPTSTTKQVSEYIQRFMTRQDAGGESLQDALKALNIPGMKVYLDQLKEIGNTQELSQAQMRAVLAIQHVITEKMEHITFKETPTDILDTGAVDCVGAGLVADVMLRRLGVPNAPMTIPGHMMTAIETADGNVYFIDMGNGSRYNRQVQKGDFEDGSTEDIHTFIHDSSDNHLELHPTPQLLPLFANKQQNQVGEDKVVVIMRPTDGVMATLMDNIAGDHEIRGNYDDAIEVYQYLSTHTRARPSNQLDLARAFISNGQIDEAEEVLKSLGARMDLRQPPYYLRGQVLEKRGNHEGALVEYRRAYEQEPLSYKVLMKLCDSLVRTGKSEEALIMMKRLNALHLFEEGRDMLNLAKRSKHSFHFEKALWSFLDASKEDPTLYYAQYGIARASYFLGDTETEQKANQEFIEHADPEEDAEYLYLIEHPDIRDEMIYEL